MDLKQQMTEWFQDLNERVQDWTEQTKKYFSQLNEYERYGWIGEGVGFVVFVVGLVLLIL